YQPNLWGVSMVNWNLSDGLYAVLLTAWMSFFAVLAYQRIRHDRRATDRLVLKYPNAWAAFHGLGAGVLLAFLSPWYGLLAAVVIFGAVRWTAPKTAQRRISRG
ncbi:hypothetical protein, partial [Streptomyces xanthophaeus]|uniref:hypothetical protein n=1 Tax=Streptomyces xanthophaeus TaxID=67385 RepID=UPI00365F8BBA